MWWYVQAEAEGVDEHGGAVAGEEVVQLGEGRVWRDWRAWVGGLEEDGAFVEGVRGERLDCYARVGVLGEEGVVEGGWAAETSVGG